MANPVSLSPREMQIARCVSKGMQNKEIADILGISLDTVKFHLSEALRKVAVLRGVAHCCRVDLAVWYALKESVEAKKQTRRLAAAA